MTHKRIAASGALLLTLLAFLWPPPTSAVSAYTTRRPTPTPTPVPRERPVCDTTRRLDQSTLRPPQVVSWYFTPSFPVVVTQDPRRRGVDLHLLLYLPPFTVRWQEVNAEGTACQDESEQVRRSFKTFMGVLSASDQNLAWQTSDGSPRLLYPDTWYETTVANWCPDRTPCPEIKVLSIDAPSDFSGEMGPIYLTSGGGPVEVTLAPSMNWNYPILVHDYVDKFGQGTLATTGNLDALALDILELPVDQPGVWMMDGSFTVDKTGYTPEEKLYDKPGSLAQLITDAGLSPFVKVYLIESTLSLP